MVQVALLHLEIFLPLAQSLKDKRHVLQGILARIRRHGGVAVAEVDHQDLWQRIAVAVVAVSPSRLPIEQLLQRVLQDLEQNAEEYQITQADLEWR
jgi:uncharacterized protein YlxP (DUF503 family)